MILHTIHNRYFLFVFILAVVLSIVSYGYYLDKHVVVSYNDARAHLDMSRLVIDNLKPGFAQMGSVWLPLNHILMLPFIWNYTLWQSGFAGSINSMIAYVCSSLFIYLLARELTKNEKVSVIASFVFMLNPNVLYMQSTPMTELTLLMFFTGASYFLLKWINETYNIIYLILCGFMVFFATLTRYDGWFLYLCLVPTIAAITISSYWEQAKNTLDKHILKKILPLIEGRLVLFITIGGFGIVLWLLWNLLIYNDPLYFMYGPYSAHAQQAKINDAGSLLTIHNWPLSLQAYWSAMLDNIGSLMMFTAIIGLIFFIKTYKLSPIALAVYTLLTPLAFHILSLYSGNSILVTPELGTSVTEQAKTSWFNVRYGLMIIPAIAVFSACWVTRSKVLQLALITLVIMQSGFFYARNDVVTLTDGSFGTSSLSVGDISDWLKKNAQDNGLILTSIAFNNALAFSTGMPLRRFIHEGTDKYWNESLENPTKHAKWIVMANGDVGDEVYEKMVKDKNQYFLKNYHLKVKGKHTNVYELVAGASASKFIGRDGSTFTEDGNEFKFVGVNSYDLAYRTQKEIDLTIASAKENGINVIRFWAFGDGFSDGFQPEDGKINDKRLDTLAYIVSAAKKNDMKLIITFANYWPDYGGTDQYLHWDGQTQTQTQQLKDAFFVSDASRNRYEKYAESIITAYNPYTKINLKDDPTIMAWELMNEPRSSSLKTAPQVVSWIDGMSTFVKTIDKNHLVFAGIEGFSPTYNDGNNGPLLSDVSKLKNIDALTAHFYLGKKEKNIADIFKTWGNEKTSADKPLFVEEVGFDKDAKDNFNQPRELLFDEVFKQVKANNLNGVVLWNWALKTDQDFGISPLDPNDETLMKQIKLDAETL